jgi:outer membrane protein assembly factor BamE (lipoprotein component of BamABCDE complex)
MKNLIWLSGCLLLFVFAGCCFFPTLPESPVVSNEITSDQLTFVTPGSTHREDVIRELGQPYIQFPDLRIMAYTWVTDAGMVIRFPTLSPEG